MSEQELQPELSQEEFDPTGTLALIFVYFAILVVMWLVMYFVEFVGGPTVVGALGPSPLLDWVGAIVGGDGAVVGGDGAIVGWTAAAVGGVI